MTATSTDIYFLVYTGSLAHDPNCVVISIGNEPQTTRLVISPECAARLAGDITKVIDRMPQHRVGAPADLGCDTL